MRIGGCAVGIGADEMFVKTWNYQVGRMEFYMGQPYVDAVLKVAAEEEE